MLSSALAITIQLSTFIVQGTIVFLEKPCSPFFEIASFGRIHLLKLQLNTGLQFCFVAKPYTFDGDAFLYLFFYRIDTL